MENFNNLMNFLDKYNKVYKPEEERLFKIVYDRYTPDAYLDWLNYCEMVKRVGNIAHWEDTKAYNDLEDCKLLTMHQLIELAKKIKKNLTNKF